VELRHVRSFLSLAKTPNFSRTAAPGFHDFVLTIKNSNKISDRVGLHFICEVRKIAAVNVMTLTRELRVSVEPTAWDLTP